jgi:hypothetical protein
VKGRHLLVVSGFLHQENFERQADAADDRHLGCGIKENVSGDQCYDFEIFFYRTKKLRDFDSKHVQLFVY